MKQTIFFSVFSAVLALMPLSAEIDCIKLTQSVKRAVAGEQSKVLEIVATEVSTAPGCSCEIVKAAIEASQAKPETVAAIVEAAATAAPEHLRLVSQCAVAVAPDSLAQVQAVVAKLDPNRGEAAASAKDSKDAKAAVGEVAAMPNPLDFPGEGPIGPPNGHRTGDVIPPGPGVVINPPRRPNTPSPVPPVTNVNPNNGVQQPGQQPG